MSAVPRPRQPLLLPMSLLHLDAVMAIEAGAYPFPWSHGNFVDSLAAGYDARVLYDDEGAILGYFVAMAGVEEMHLLNITVAPRAWHLGHGRFMLDALEALCRERGARQLWLEVRVSNERARAIYRRRGFAEVGRRKGYYPDARGKREDACSIAGEVADVGVELGDGYAKAFHALSRENAPCRGGGFKTIAEAGPVVLADGRRQPVPLFSMPAFPGRSCRRPRRP